MNSFPHGLVKQSALAPSSKERTLRHIRNRSENEKNGSFVAFPHIYQDKKLMMVEIPFL
jgi:hypothetical protein